MGAGIARSAGEAGFTAAMRGIEYRFIEKALTALVALNQDHILYQSQGD
jgi:hypothetical protein